MIHSHCVYRVFHSFHFISKIHSFAVLASVDPVIEAMRNVGFWGSQCEFRCVFELVSFNFVDNGITLENFESIRWFVTQGSTG